MQVTRYLFEHANLHHKIQNIEFQMASKNKWECLFYLMHMLSGVFIAPCSNEPPSMFCLKIGVEVLLVVMALKGGLEPNGTKLHYTIP
jgi:hypothetical protein